MHFLLRSRYALESEIQNEQINHFLKVRAMKNTSLFYNYALKM